MKHAITLSAHQIGYIRGEHRLFGGIDFELKAGTALRITGANGSGKTSMLRILSGIAPPERGNVRWHGCDIRAIRDVYSSERLYVGHAIGVKDDLLAWENVALNSLMSGKRIDRRQACEALVNSGLKAAVDLPARALSQGQRKRLALMRLRFATTRRYGFLMSHLRHSMRKRLRLYAQNSMATSRSAARSSMSPIRRLRCQRQPASTSNTAGSHNAGNYLHHHSIRTGTGVPAPR